MKWLALLLLLVSCGGSAPESARYDKAYYGYFLTAPSQLDETRDHVSLLWEVGFWGEDQLRANVAQLPAVVDAQAYLADDSTFLAFVQRLQPVWGNVLAISIGDEPDLWNDEARVRDYAGRVRRLTDKPLAVIYAGASRLTAIELFDWVGLDNYPQHEDVLTRDYPKLFAALRPGQRTILVPGGATLNGTPGDDPAVFVEFAMSHGEVVAIVPFLWTSPSWEKDMVGIRDNSLRAAYVAAGTKVKQ